jgi:hypothetical protein
MTVGPASTWMRMASSLQLTTLWRCKRFTMLQCPRRKVSNRAASACFDARLEVP